MGTSISHRSPATPEWERVRKLYRQPNPQPGEVVAHIVWALDPSTRQAMSHAGVTVCLDTALAASRDVATSGLEELLEGAGLAGRGPAVLCYASALRDTARRRLVEASASSRFAELALDGLAVTMMQAATGGQADLLENTTQKQAEAFIGSYFSEQCLHDLSTTFLGCDLDRVFQYFVARDLSDFVGTEALPSVGYASRLLDQVAAHCRGTVNKLELGAAEPLLQQATVAPVSERVPLVQGFLQDAISQALGLLGSGGAT